MARLNEILVGRFNKALQKLFGIKGPPPVATLAPEIMPVTIISQGNESRWVDGWNRFGVTMTQTGSAGNNATFQLRNPGSSNMIGVLEKIELETGTGQQITLSYQFNGANLTAPSVAFPLDGRQGLSAGSMCVPSSQITSGAGGNIIGSFFVPTATQFKVYEDIMQEIAVTPGNQLQVNATTNATQVTVTFWWRERFLEESERQ